MERAGIVRRVWTSPPEIFRNSGTHQYTGIEGRSWMLRSDFPVLCYFNDDLVAGIGNKYGGPVVRFKTPKAGPYTVRFRFPVGFGVNGAGALQSAQLYGQHGVCCLEGAWDSDTVLEPPDPRQMAFNVLHYNQVFTNPTLGLWAFTAGIGQYWTKTDFRMPANSGSDNNAPNEIWLTEHTISVEQSLGPAAGGARPYEVLLHKENSPTNDGTYKILDGSLTGGGTDAYTTGPTAWVGYSGVQKAFNPLGFQKVPIRSLFQPWAAETPRLEFFTYGPAYTGSIVVRGAIGFAYQI